MSEQIQLYESAYGAIQTLTKESANKKHRKGKVEFLPGAFGENAVALRLYLPLSTVGDPLGLTVEQQQWFDEIIANWDPTYVHGSGSNAVLYLIGNQSGQARTVLDIDVSGLGSHQHAFMQSDEYMLSQFTPDNMLKSGEFIWDTHSCDAGIYQNEKGKQVVALTLHRLVAGAAYDMPSRENSSGGTATKPPLLTFEEALAVSALVRAGIVPKAVIPDMPIPIALMEGEY